MAKPKRPDLPELVTAAQLAALLGFTTNFLSQMVGAGVLTRQPGRTFKLKEAVQAMVRYYRTKSTSADRLAAKKLEIESVKCRMLLRRDAVEAGKLVELVKVDAAVSELILAARTRLVTLPKKIAPILLSQRTAKEVETTLEREIHAALSELAKEIEYGQPDLPEDAQHLEEEAEPEILEAEEPEEPDVPDAEPKPRKRARKRAPKKPPATSEKSSS